MKNIYRDKHARAYRETLTLLRRGGDHAHRQGSQSASADMDCERDLHRYLSLLQQAEFLHVGCIEYTIQ